VGEGLSDGATVYTASVEGAATRVAAVDAASGRELRSTVVDGAFELPVVTSAGLLGGLSHDGSTLVLQQPGYPSRLAIVDTSFAEPAEVIELAGEFSYDALSPDGHLLYLIEHLPPANSDRYNVRVYDLLAGRLGANPIVDKRVAAAGPMSGYPVARAETADGGWVYTLYQGDHAFVHALDTAGGAFCIDLPQSAASAEAVEAWTLRLDPEHARLYVENAELGLTVTIDTERLAVLGVAGADGQPLVEALAG
jgi:hypothetical protein